MTDLPEQTNIATSRLEGWKAIAGYLNRDVRTAKRWEAQEALPIHRHRHAARSSVYAFQDELDVWRANRRPAAKEQPVSLTARQRALTLAPAILTVLLAAGGGRVPTAVVAAGQASSDAQEVVRKVITASGVISRDGRRLVSIDRNGNPVVREIATGAERPLTRDASYARNWATMPAISRDGRQVAFWWMNLDERRAEIRVASLNGDGAAVPRMLLPVDEDIYPLDWSPDGKWIAIAGAAGISLVSVEDGSRRRLHVLTGRAPDGVFFSPDGRYLAFDAYAGQVTNPFDVFVLAIDGSGVVRAVEHPSHDRIMEWSPDGRHLLFTSDRSGSVDLWALPMTDGKPAGSATMVRRGLALGRSLGLSPDGALFMQVSLPDRDVQVVRLDLDSGRQMSPLIRPIQQFVGMNEQPAWSRDGKHLAYVSRRDREPFPVIAIRAEDTGDVKELRPNLPDLRGIDWRPDGRELVGAGSDLEDNGVMFRIDVRSGKVTLLAVSTIGFKGFFPQWSSNGQRIYYRKPLSETSGEYALVERDLTSAQERELIRGEDLGGHRLSPDGQWIAVVRSRRHIVLVPVRPGAIRELFPVTPPAYLRWNTIAWRPDGRAVIARVNSTNGGGENTSHLWLVPTDGATPRRLDVDVHAMPGPAFSGIALHPDGRRLAVVSDGETRHEVWALERFLPALTRR